MKLIKKIKKRIKKMNNPLKDKLESDFLILLLLATAATAVFVIMLNSQKQLITKTVKHRGAVIYYPAPFEVAKIKGNPEIVPV